MVNQNRFPLQVSERSQPFIIIRITRAYLLPTLELKLKPRVHDHLPLASLGSNRHRHSLLPAYQAYSLIMIMKTHHHHHQKSRDQTNENSNVCLGRSIYLLPPLCEIFDFNLYASFSSIQFLILYFQFQYQLNKPETETIKLRVII